MELLGVGLSCTFSLPTETVKTKEYLRVLHLQSGEMFTLREVSILMWYRPSKSADGESVLKYEDLPEEPRMVVFKCSVTSVDVDICNLHTCLFKGYDIYIYNYICRLIWVCILVSNSKEKKTGLSVWKQKTDARQTGIYTRIDVRNCEFYNLYSSPNFIKDP
jgi:hypothetical protein